MKTKRTKRNAADWNPIPVLLSPIIKFLGGESVIHAERDKEDIENVIHILEVNNEKFAGSLKDISIQMAKVWRVVHLILKDLQMLQIVLSK